jgi:hypothetical protein
MPRHLQFAPRRLLAVALVVLSGVVADAAERAGIHNFSQATANVYSGSEPEADADFAALAKLGAKPDVALAAQHGLRYVHLPFGYDGIPADRVAELAQAARTLPGPFFVHCHHGKHRGPAAVGVLGQANGSFTAAQADQFMHQAGTSPEYPGLYRAATNFVLPTPAQLAAVPTNFPSVARTSSLVETMVALDAHHAHLQAVQKAGWHPTPGHPDLAPAHEATLLWEQLRELARTADTAPRPAFYREQLATSAAAAAELRTALRAPTPDTTRADAAFQRLSQACIDCHKRYRNQ